MPTLLSPGVSIVEIDLTTIVPAVSATSAAFAGDFAWGPCYTTQLVDMEASLIRWFSYPNNRNAQDWFTAWNFLNYGNSLYVSRVVNTTSANTAQQARNATTANSSGVLVLNENAYYSNYANGQLESLYGAGAWIGRYPGALGNSIKISMCASANCYQSTLSGTLTVSPGNTSVTGTNTHFTTQLSNTDLVVINEEVHVISTVNSDTSLTLAQPSIVGAVANVCTRRWQYYDEVSGPPTTTVYANTFGVQGDEIHVVIVDSNGLWTGTPGQVLETYQAVSLASDATAEDGTDIYYVDSINRQSQKVFWASHAGGLTDAGLSISLGQANSFGRPNFPIVFQLEGGSDGIAPADQEKINGYSLFESTDAIDITVILGGNASATAAQYIISNVAEERMDAVVFLSPPMTTCVDNAGNEATDIIEFRNSLSSSSYAFLDSGWKYQYDKFNDVYRWVNGDIAGLYVRTATTNDPWWSPAGLNRGIIKNVVQLAWNPAQSDRDQLYNNSINPVITSAGIGTLLYGDKTLLSKPSAFDRINVRMLFIVLEKAIGLAAKYTLFEFNDAFTQSQFVNMVEPYLRDVQGRRGIYDFDVVCDSTNNTADIIDSNSFVADIYIKPARSINFIYLSFVAVRTGVAFSEVVGQTGSI
jgi:phage tail sheath protein FI